MKIFKSIFALLVFTALITSCDNEPIDPAIDPNALGTSSGVFTAKIDGTNFSADETFGDYTSSTIGNQLVISGLSSSGKTISIQLINPAVGSFPASTTSTNLNLLQYFDASLGALGGAFSSYNPITDTSIGTVTITDFNTSSNKVSGTFSFEAYNVSNSTTKSITTGVFNNIEFDNAVD